MTEEGAGRHLDELASKYAGRTIRYFGEAIAALRWTEIPVLCRIRPTHVVALDATRREAGDDRSARARAGRDPRLAPGPADPPICGVLTTMGPDGQPQSSLVWVDTDGECAGSTPPSSARRVATYSLIRRSACWSSTPTTRHALSSSAATPSSSPTGRTTISTADPQVHPPSGLLRPHLPPRAAGPRDPGHRPDPRPTDHARRHPRLNEVEGARRRSPRRWHRR